MINVLVCRMNQDPAWEETKSGFVLLKGLVKNAFLLYKTIVVGEEQVLMLYPENDDGKFKHNRNVPALCALPEDMRFVVDNRPLPPEFYAKNGEMGYFPICGPFILTTNGENGEEATMSDTARRVFTELLKLPRCKREQCDNPVAYPGAVYCGAGCTARAEAGE